MSTSSGPKGPLFPTTMTSGAQVTRARGVIRGADANHAIQATAASGIIGVAYDNADVAERQFRVIHRPGETTFGEAGAAIAAPAAGGQVKLTTDAQGRFITASTGNPVAAFACESASAAGDLLCIEIAPLGLVA